MLLYEKPQPPKIRASDKIRKFLKTYKYPSFLQNCKWLKGEGKACFGGSEKLETGIYTGITQIGKSFNTMKVKIESKTDGREVLDLLYV